MRLLGALTSLAVAAATALSATAASAAPDPGWAPAASASITPGVQMLTEGAQCTANFVFTDRKGRVYLGYSAHCAGLGEATDTSGCGTGSHPLGTRVTFTTGVSSLSEGTRVGEGRLAYSSWLAMDALGLSEGPECAFNDFALVRVLKRDRAKVNPTLPVWGGPTALARGTDLGLGDQVFSYGNSSLRGGLTLLSPKAGLMTSKDASGWSYSVYTATPGIPGDSGSGVVDAQGRALGTVSTIGLAPLPGENGVADLRRQVKFAKKHGGIKGLRLVPGTEPFRGVAGALGGVSGLLAP